MITYSRAETEKDLKGILSLQQSNLAKNLSGPEIQSQGFVTVCHSYADLWKLNCIEPHIIAKENGTVIGYLLAMTTLSKFDIPVLVPMFTLFDAISYQDQLIASYNYVVVGQVCVDKQYRGQGILDDCYSFYRNQFKQKYDFAITEIAASNLRSLKAHQRVGFSVIYDYVGPEKTAWKIVCWDWAMPGAG